MFWNNAEQVAHKALQQGALLPISTQVQIIAQDGINYNIHLKSANSQVKFAPKPKGFNPFLPYDQQMFVAQAGDDHVCLLNKFPVMAPHLLICSNKFIEQTVPLSYSDFAAWVLGFDNDEVIGFYNGGKIAGASQPHRHMQLFKSQIPTRELITSGKLPFEHQLFNYSSLDPQILYQDYIGAMKALNLYHPQQCQPYNILLHSQWMVIIPRSRNNIEGIFANGINYTGHFLVADQQQIPWLQQYGILRFLTDCSSPSFSKY